MTILTRKGEGVHTAKLTEEKVRAIKADQRTLWVIARDYKVTAATVSMIKNGKTWKHIK